MGDGSATCASIIGSNNKYIGISFSFYVSFLFLLVRCSRKREKKKQLLAKLLYIRQSSMSECLLRRMNCPIMAYVVGSVAVRLYSTWSKRFGIQTYYNELLRLT